MDIVLIFDGGKLILPGLAFALVALDAPSMVAEEGAINGQHILSLVGDTRIADQMPTIRLTDMEQKAVPADEKTERADG